MLLKRVYGLDVNSDDDHDWTSMKVDVDSAASCAHVHDGGRRKSDETVRWEDLDDEARREVVARAERETSHHEEAKEQAEAATAAEADDEGSNSPRLRCV